MHAQDKNGVPYAALHPIYRKSTWLAFGAASSSYGPFDPATKVLKIYTTQSCAFEIGDSSVTAIVPTSSPLVSGSHWLVAGQYLDIALGVGDSFRETYIAVIRTSSDGILVISEME